jgi:O-antigen ligase
MQGRAAQLGILSSAAVLVWKISSSHLRFRPIIFLGMATLAITLIATIDMPGLAAKILMLDDQYRGEGSDFSGRAEYWGTAINTWMEYPLLGAGSDYSTRLDVLQPHSFFLYPLACYGILGIALLLIFFRAFFVVFFSGRALYMLAFIPMLAFNDRFINLNTYPTIMFLYVFSEYARLGIAKRRTRLFASFGRAKPNV